MNIQFVIMGPAKNKSILSQKIACEDKPVSAHETGKLADVCPVLGEHLVSESSQLLHFQVLWILFHCLLSCILSHTSPFLILLRWNSAEVENSNYVLEG